MALIRRVKFKLSKTFDVELLPFTFLEKTDLNFKIILPIHYYVCFELIFEALNTNFVYGQFSVSRSVLFQI